MTDTIGTPFRVQEAAVADALAGLGPWVAVVNEPPWDSLRPGLPEPLDVVRAWEMDIDHLESLVRLPDGAETVVGIGGGTALDTAKFLAWRSGARLVQVPTIASVDAGFTDAVGVRVGRRVTYVGSVVPEVVVVDLDTMAAAPARLNRGGIGDVLSCHTGLADWRIAVGLGEGVPWRDDLAALGRTLLVELGDAADDVGAVSRDGLRFLVSAYRRIGAACAQAGHSRFEEGSEHFLAYAYEFRTGAHLVHGELISMSVVAMATLQGNDPEWARDVVTRAGVRANPLDLGMSHDDVVAALTGLREFSRREGLDVSVADTVEIDAKIAESIWDVVSALPRVAS